MLLEFSCSNHRSIRDEVLFSAIAGTDRTHAENIERVAGVEVLKAAVIYGANGSGKSNFIDAISFVKNLVSNSINHQPGQGILQTPHKLDGYERKSNYKIQFIVDGIRYAFGFSLKNMLVVEEYLYYFPNGRQTKIFERVGEEYSAGRNFRNRFNSCKDVLKPNRLMLSCAANFSSVDEVIAAYHFFNDELVIYSSANQENWMNYSLHQINANEQMKAIVLKLLDALDTGIKDIHVDIKKEDLDVSHLPPFLSDEFKKVLLQEKIDAISAKVLYEGFETDLISEESTGIKKLFGILCPFIDIMVNGKVLVCDELETNLHESLLFGLVKQFVNMRGSKPAQLIFTTHETGLLNLDLFRRDQIWFTEIKLADRSTDLFSLTEIKNVRKDENFGKGYIAGKYGAIPMLNLNFANVISSDL
ncbi:MAG TPA: ATP-binding protein [Candidatus Enterocloster excrementigallinarum]|uniref:ATP-binding protein n=1 Tax=Candidatus Enterocloster excrementigallinarum TaxID=2838558 RepID=A0A9D2PXE4_9FIRM|nr:ATP-binding protein [Candidatus Enterocloster excrementigallinarum]